MLAQNIFSMFVDPVLRAPTIGCMLMCLAASLMGVVVFLRKQSLIGEALSHASYPGVILGIITAAFFSIDDGDELILSLLVILGGLLSSLVGIWVISFLENKGKVASDAALCFVLSTFFGIGLTLTSEVQFAFTSLYRRALSYLYGQAATMTDVHILIYGGLALIVILVIGYFYKELQVITFDREFAKSLGIPVKMVDCFLFGLVALAVMIGIRSVGIILMSAMLIAPAVAARQFTHRLNRMFLIAAIFGMLSGFFGIYFSIQLSEVFSRDQTSLRIILPTGPMIVLIASMICIFALLFAPERGLAIRLWRIALFRYTCLCENILKEIWRIEPQKQISKEEISKYHQVSSLYLSFILWRMARNGWLEKKKNEYALTKDGSLRAVRIVRLHRLWEVYLANYLGMGAERVHRNAEEMEHILTPEIERELTLLLKNPKVDPHSQPIPGKRTI